LLRGFRRAEFSGNDEHRGGDNQHRGRGVSVDQHRVSDGHRFSEEFSETIR